MLQNNKTIIRGIQGQTAFAETVDEKRAIGIDNRINRTIISSPDVKLGEKGDNKDGKG